MPDVAPPPFARSALLLDLDGTLLDIAPTPDAVRVEDGLLETLTTLRHALGGALAVISGRPIAQIDALLGATPHAVAGEHGGALRHAPDAPVVRPDLAVPSAAMRAAAEAIASQHAASGVWVETKERGFVLHYRAAPTLGGALQGGLRPLVAAEGGRFLLLPAHMAWEVRPAGADKGTALRALMAAPPFEGRLPVFIGDDVTDRDAIAAADAMGGAGLMVPDTLGTAAGVRAWLARAAAGATRGYDWPRW
jgi:trehalose 6-phosphate phosphatase